MNESTKERSFTPALGSSRLTPLYDTAIALLTRESTWRDELVHSIAPTENDRILDVGCGTGSLTIRLKQTAMHAQIIGIDPDPNVLAIAHRKSQRAGVEIDWIQGFLDPTTATNIGKVSKIVSSLMFHQTPLSEKKRILSAMRQALVPGGRVYIADYGQQRTWLMRMLFRLTVQLFDGIEDTQPNAEGVMPDLIRQSGLIDVQESSLIRTTTGSISFYQAACPVESPIRSDD